MTLFNLENAIMNASLSNRSALQAQHPYGTTAPPVLPVELSQQLDLAFRFVAQHAVSLPDPFACCVLFFTMTSEKLPVTSFSIRRVTIHAAWREGATRVRQWAWANNAEHVELRVDWACGIKPIAANASPTGANDSSRTWALADDELEQAKLLNALGHSTSRNLADMDSLSEPVTSSTHARWQLLLEGVYIDPHGSTTALPRPRLSPTHLRNSPAGPTLYRAAQQLIAQRQSDDGSWPEASSLLDHLGITYALLLAQQHTPRDGTPPQPTAHASHRAIVYMIEQMRRWSLYDDGSEELQSLSLLVLMRYIGNFPGAGNAAPIKNLVAKLSQQLRTAAARPAADQTPWAQLAMDAVRQSQPSTTQDTLVPAAGNHPSYEGKWLLAAWQQLRLVTDDGGRPAPQNQPWISAAVLECSLRDGLPRFSSDATHTQFHSGMQALFRACYQRIVWPEMALFQSTTLRKQAAFFSPRTGNTLVSDCRLASQLLITISASINFSDKQSHH